MAQMVLNLNLYFMSINVKFAGLACFPYTGKYWVVITRKSCPEDKPKSW